MPKTKTAVAGGGDSPSFLSAIRELLASYESGKLAFRSLANKYKKYHDRFGRKLKIRLIQEGMGDSNFFDSLLEIAEHDLDTHLLLLPPEKQRVFINSRNNDRRKRVLETRVIEDKSLSDVSLEELRTYLDSTEERVKKPATKRSVYSAIVPDKERGIRYRGYWMPWPIVVDVIKEAVAKGEIPPQVARQLQREIAKAIPPVKKKKSAKRRKAS